MKFTVLVSLLASAAAFAPAQQGTSSTALKASPWDAKLGVQAPLGFFDPLGMLKDAPEAYFEDLRAKELKHGRIAQLAFLGNIVVLSGIRFPGSLSYDGPKFADLPNHGIEAIQQVPTAGLVQILMFIAAVEIGSSTLVGDFKGDFTGVNSDWTDRWGKLPEKTKQKKMQIELNNGRAAMMGIWGLVTHELIGNLDSMPIISGVNAPSLF